MNRLKGIRVVSLLAVTVVVLASLAPSGRSARAAGHADAAQAAASAAQDPGATSYAEHCAICHGDHREGNLPGFPPLLGISHRMNDDKIVDLVHAGKGRMPGFPALGGGELTALMHFLNSVDPAPAGGGATGLSVAGGALFQQNCAFCHGRDAQGGETGPDLTQSKLVRKDRTGEEIAKVIREGRPDNKMPPFNFSETETRGLIAFIREREADAVAHPGARRGVSVADLQTGNAEAGRRYFEGAGGCAKCHSPKGDLSGIATRFEGLELEQRMLYPRGATSHVTITLPSGEKVSGALAYHDEFTVALRDPRGIYRSWPAAQVRYSIEAPAEAHVDLFSKYTDDDIHNLLAYLETLH